MRFGTFGIGYCFDIRISIFGFLLALFLLFPIESLRAEDSKYTPLRVLLHVHSEVSGEDVPFEKIAAAAQRKGIDAVILTDYFEQKISFGLFSYSKPSIKKSGIGRYFDKVDGWNAKQPPVLFIAGAEVTPFYWWYGGPLSGGWTVNDMQKNLLVFGLASDVLPEIPTLENGRKEWKRMTARSEKPYQEVIDFTKARGGISIWSTPDEAFGADFKAGPVHFSTPAYTESLVETKDYTGIGIYPEGNIKTGIPDGIWDALLRAYTRGKLARPVWAFAENVLHKKGFDTVFGQWDNMVYVKEVSEAGIIEAMKAGRFYIRELKKGQVLLEDFSLKDSVTGQSAFLGEELTLKGFPQIHARVSLSPDLLPDKILLDVIKQGKVIHSEESAEGVLDFTWTDDNPSPGSKKAAYRIAVITRPQNYVSLLSNPVFAARED